MAEAIAASVSSDAKESLEEHTDGSDVSGDESEARDGPTSAFADALAGELAGGGGAAEGLVNLGVVSSLIANMSRRASVASSVTSDELELIIETQTEAKQRARSKRKLLKPLSELHEVDKRIAAIGQGNTGYWATLSAKVQEYGLQLPTIRVEYTGLTVETDALVGSAGLPTVGNAALNLLKRLVCVQPASKKHRILDNLKGVLLPGRATLLLGPPSSGKTTFMKVLAGHYKHSRRLRITGDLKYNGCHQDEFVIERTAGFISQHDVHVPSLTVLETLEYAFVCQNGTGADGFYLPQELAKAYERKLAERAAGGVPGRAASTPDEVAHQRLTDEQFLWLVHEHTGTGAKTLSTMRLLGIAHTKNTPVGDSMLRGVSGGERKRVTTAEMMVGPKRLLLADEISTGLDSATLFSIIRLLVRICRGMQLNVLISLLQPPPEVFDLFDDLILMTDGHIIYHGPVGDVMPFFNDLGFLLPPRKDVPSFLQEVTTPSGQLEFASPELRRAKGLPPVAVSEDVELSREFLVPVTDMVDAFWKSPAGVAMQALVDAPLDPSLGHAQALARRRYALRPLEALWVVLKRQLLMVGRDRALVVGRIVQCLVLGCIIGSLFFQMSPTIGKSRSFFGAFFLHILFVSMGQLPVMATTMATKAVWFKHRDSFFYPPIVHAFACMLASIPTVMVDTACYTVIVYFMNGFYRQPGYFFTFYCVMTVFAVNCSAIFRLVAHICPDGVSANAYGGVVLLVLVVLSGFAIVRASIPGWWIWAYYVSPYSWALRGLVINEMTSPRWAYPAEGTPAQTAGEQALRSFTFFTERHWIWAGVGYMVGGTLVWTMLSAAALQHLSGTPRVARVADDKQLQRAREDAARRKNAAVSPKPPAPAPSGSLSNAAGSLAQSPVAAAPGPHVNSGNSVQLGDVDLERGSGAGRLAVSLARNSWRRLRNRTAVTAAQVLGRKKPNSLPVAVDSSIPFTPVSLAFLDLRYFVPNPSYTGKGARPRATTPPASGPGQADVTGSAPNAAAAQPAPADVEQGHADAACMAGPVAETTEVEKNTQGDPSEVPQELELLKGITGYAEPRMLMALMGGSGAGKTTLMDCIAGRKTMGRIEGDIYVNGHPKDQRTWARVIGYVEQMDIHTPALTVNEALQFSARLRLPASVSDEQARLYVEEVMDIVDLTDNQFDLTGVPGQSGLSVEQRKRLTIAVELVSNPAVVFMDEPTSGLDARAAAVVMRAVRNVARNNRAVMVTIHQPSIEIFETFDFLLLLQRGGRTTYFGPLGDESSTLIAYLEAVPGCPKIGEGANPATWMLEVTGGAAAVAARAVQADWPTLYKHSGLAARNAQHAQELVERLSAIMEPLENSGKYAATFRVQFFELLKKFNAAYWRTPSYNWTRFKVTVLVALFYGSTFYRQVARQQNIQNVLGVIFSSNSFLGMANMMAIMPFMGVERVVYYREQASSMYSSWIFGAVSTIVEIPYLLAQVSVFVCIMYPMIRFIIEPGHFFFYFLITFESIMFYSTFGAALVFITPSQQLAQVVGAGLNFLFNIMNGFVIAFPNMPNYYQWANRGSPTTWVLYALGADQLAGLDTPFSQPDIGENTTVGEYQTRVFGYKYDFRFNCIAILIAYIAFCRAVSVLGLRYISFLKR